MVGYTKEQELHDRYQISSQWVLVIGISKKNTGFHIKYDTVGLPAVHDVPGLEKSLDACVHSVLKDLSGFKDATAFSQYLERKACDVMLHEVGKEPKVVVVVQ